MAVFEQFPYTNFHDLNLDKIITKVDQAAADAAAASQAAVQAAASIDIVRNYPAKAYKELTVRYGFVTTNSDYITSAQGRMIGLVLSGGSLILCLDGLLFKSSLSFTAGTEYKIADIDDSALPFLPEKFYVITEGMFNNTTALKITASLDQTNHADGIYVEPVANFTTSGSAREIECVPTVVPFFTDIA